MTYAETRQRFLNRCASTLPNVLHSSFILDEIGDAYPQIHTAERDYVCALDSHEEIIRKADALTDDDVKTIVLSYVPDAIVSELEENDDEEFQFSAREADEIMSLAREIDPSESGIAAAIRDTIRDNFDHITL